MESRTIGLLVIAIALLLLLVGVLAYYGALDWFGRLPGDVRIERGNTRIYFPIVSMVVISIVLSVLLSLVRRLR
jgi:uncharacterized membrane protein